METKSRNLLLIFFGILVKAEIPDVLSCIGQFCAKQVDGP